jgi:hypothetical protein
MAFHKKSSCTQLDQTTISLFSVEVLYGTRLHHIITPTALSWAHKAVLRGNNDETDLEADFHVHDHARCPCPCSFLCPCLESISGSMAVSMPSSVSACPRLCPCPCPDHHYSCSCQCIFDSLRYCMLRPKIGKIVTRRHGLQDRANSSKQS